jgi:enoyl-CoA hydratase
MNARLHHFAKPWVSVWDGIVMGGGVGISAHGSHRVVTERTLFAMPETGIGLFPDVGATWLLPRLPGAIGMYLGLTGARLGPADCLYAALGSAFVPADRLQALAAELAGADLSSDPFAAVDRVLRGFQDDPGPAELPALRERIDACFGQPSLEAVLNALENEPSGWGRAQLELLLGKSPTSLAVTFRQIRKGAGLDFDAAMRLEYRLVHRFMAGHDFREGVRAAVIDKDNRPRWRPARLEDVSTADIDGYFAPLAGGELMLGDRT